MAYPMSSDCLLRLTKGIHSNAGISLITHGLLISRHYSNQDQLIDWCKQPH